MHRRLCYLIPQCILSLLGGITLETLYCTSSKKNKYNRFCGQKINENNTIYMILREGMKPLLGVFLFLDNN